jgi:hypothetical protein
MEADFAVDRTIIVEFGPSISEDGVHLVGALPREVDGIGKEGAIEVTDHTSELELTTPSRDSEHSGHQWPDWPDAGEHWATDLQGVERTD